MPRLAKKPKSRLAALNLKVPQDVRERLEQQAETSGRSLTQEVIHLLLSRLTEDDAVERSLGGREMYGLFRAMAGIADSIQVRTGAKWSEDFETYVAVRSGWIALMNHYRSKPTPGFLEERFGPVPEDPGPPPDPPKRPPMGMLRQSRKEDLVAYAEASEKFQRALKEWQEKDELQKAYSRQTKKYFDELLAFGRDTAAEWTLPAKKKES